MRKGREMRVFRVLVVGTLMAGGLVLLAPGASGSVPTVSKACKSLKSLDKKLNKVIAGGESGNYDSGAINDVSKSFKYAEDRSEESPLCDAHDCLRRIGRGRRRQPHHGSHGAEEGGTKACGSGRHMGEVPCNELRGVESLVVLSEYAKPLGISTVARHRATARSACAGRAL